MLEVLQSMTVVAEEIAAVGTEVSVVIVVFAVAVQPLLAVTTTEYVPATETTLVANVVPSFQRYVPTPDAVKVMLEVLQSMTVVAEEIAAVGTEGSVVIVVFADAVQPLLAVITTEYVPALEILFVADVLPSFHK
jgi:voltage-gated potassium channel Kch